MPFTPFHMGPGIFIKALLQGSFSLLVFGWSQIIMDLQPLLALLTGVGAVHGFTHTYIGASLLAVLAAVSGKYLSERGLAILKIAPQGELISISWRIAILSAFIGSFSHVMLDSLMHLDIQPFYPFNGSNNLLNIVTVENLHKLCVYSGLFGAGLYFLVQYLINNRSRH